MIMQAACDHRREYGLTRNTGDPLGPPCCGRCGKELELTCVTTSMDVVFTGALADAYKQLGYEAQLGHRVLVGPDPDGQGGSFGVVMGDQVRIVSTGQIGKLVRRRIGSPDDRVVVLVDGEAVEAQGQDVAPWEGVTA